MGTKLFHKGAHWTIESLETADGKVPAEQFLESFSAHDDRHGRARSRLLAIIELQANTPHGQRLDETKFKDVTDVEGILEFKADQLRLFCFFAPGMRIVLANGYLKKSDKDKGYKAALRQALQHKESFQAESRSSAKLSSGHQKHSRPAYRKRN